LIGSFAATWALLQRGDGSLGRLITILTVVFIVVVPLIKAVREALAKARELAEKSPDTFGRDSEARKRFEALLRGEELPDAPPPPRSPPRAAAPPVIKEARERAVQDVAEARRPPAKKPLVVLDEIPARPLSGPELEAREGASEPEIAADRTRRERDELERQRVAALQPAQIAREEYAASSSQREEVAPTPVAVFDAALAASEPAGRASAAARRWLGAAADTDRRGALRRALVMNEVLGRPLGLRDGARPAGGLER
jgi:hypothetical protein